MIQSESQAEAESRHLRQGALGAGYPSERDAVLLSDSPASLDDLLVLIDDQGYPVTELIQILSGDTGTSARDAIDCCLSAWIRLLSAQNQREQDWVDPAWVRIRTRRLGSQTCLIMLRDHIRSCACFTLLEPPCRADHADSVPHQPQRLN